MALCRLSIYQGIRGGYKSRSKHIPGRNEAISLTFWPSWDAGSGLGVCQDDTYGVAFAIGHQWDAERRLSLAIDFDAPNLHLIAPRILHRNLVGGGAVPIGYPVSVPAGWNT